MPSIQVLSDTTFSTHATEAVDTLVDANGCPVKRSQISGLRQIAVNQPRSVKEFAEHQRRRAERRMENASRNAQEKIEKEIEFWKLIANLVDGKRPRCLWSLQQEAEGALPQDLKVESTPAGANLTREEQTRRAATKKLQHDWLVAWKDLHCPAFFQRFCAHYLYCLAKRGP
jgi:hypothetical protein